MSQQSKPRDRRSWLGNVIFLALCCIGGAVIGMLVFKPLLGKSEAIGIIAIGSIGAGDSAAPLEQVDALTTRMIAKDFAAAVAKRLSDIDAAEQMLAPVYGGHGDLSARALRDGNRIEIRVSNASEKTATERLTAVMDEVLEQHAVIATSLLSFAVKQRDRYQEMLAGEETLDQKLAGEITASASRGADFDALLAARSKVIEQISTITQTLTKLNQAMSKPFFKRSEALAGPSPLQPLLKSFWQTALLGALAGFALGFMGIQIRRGLV